MEPEMEKIIPMNRLRVTDRKEAGREPEDRPDQQDRRPPFRRPEILPEGHETGDLSWWGCHVEIGGLLLAKRTIEQSLFTRLPERSDTTESTELAPELARIHQRIAELERRLQELESEPIPVVGATRDPDPMIADLLTAQKLYEGFEELTERLAQAIDREDLNTLESISSAKGDLLERIRQVQSGIDFSQLQSLPEDSEKRVKAGRILTDINLKLRQILDKENTNSVELQTRKEALRIELSRSALGARAITRYSKAENPPRFIDTTK
jgi:hypothetical protein